jgi:hypothetical protein
VCKGRARLAGIVKSGALAARHMPGYSGMAKVKYTGTLDQARLSKSLFSGLAYEYGTVRPEFYIDARDIGRVLAWQEDGERVFEIV